MGARIWQINRHSSTGKKIPFRQSVTRRRWSIHIHLGDRNDGVRAGLQLGLDLGTNAALALSSIDSGHCITLSPLTEPAIEDDLDSRVAGEALSEICIEVGM